MTKFERSILPTRSPVGSDTENEITKNTIVNVILEDEINEPLKETVIKHKKSIFIEPEELEEREEPEEPEEPEEAEEAEEKEPEEAEEKEPEKAGEKEPEEQETDDETEEAEETDDEEEKIKKEENIHKNMDENLKKFIVLCTHKYLYDEPVPSFTQNTRRQQGMEKIIARHVDSICEAFKYIS